MPATEFRRLATLRSAEEFRTYASDCGSGLECDDEVVVGPDSPLRQPVEVAGRLVGNRWTAQPMEGWDCTLTGHATEAVVRRWRRFGESGAKLIWGGEAMAVRADGRANPYQLMIDDEHASDLAMLRATLIAAHRERYGSTDDLLIGFQLTHSGRFCRPYADKRMYPRIAYRHPLLDRRVGVADDSAVLTDAEIQVLIEDYVRAAKVAQRVGADFVDVKHCHGYLLHEFLSARRRGGDYGGSFENRTRVLRDIVAGIRAEAPGLLIGVRVSAFDLVPFRPAYRDSTGRLGPGVPEDYSALLPYECAFGADPCRPTETDLAEPIRFLALLEALDIRLVNITGGSPYYNPHIQRPAMFPPSDGYQPPEDPLVGVGRHVAVTRQLKAHFPKLFLVGTAYTYLQEYLPQVAQFNVGHGYVDSVGLGRTLLSYPALLADATARGAIDRRLLCRTFSDCTTGPRNGLPSGCYPLDPYYKQSPDAEALRLVKGGAG